MNRGVPAPDDDWDAVRASAERPFGP